MKSEREWQKRALAGLIAIGVCLSLLFPQNAFAEKLAIHATQAEVNIWRQRIASGPYKDDWDVILSRANSATPPRWDKAVDGCFPDRVRDRVLRDAGFVYLLTGDIAYRNKVRDALLAQMAIASTDFSDTNWWDVDGGVGATCGGLLNETIWLRHLTYAYSYIRDSLTSTQRIDLDAWFLKVGNFFERLIHRVASARFPNRLSDDYTCSGGHCPGIDDGLLYFGGPTAKRFSMAWDNIAGNRAALFTAIGVLLDHATLKARAKRYYEEWVKYAMYADGTIYDQRRWDFSGKTAQSGYNYLLTNLGSHITIADHMARAGDNSLYEFTTSEGMFGTEGGPKNMLKALKHAAGLTNGTKLHYASHTETSDPDLLIRQSGPGGKVILYIYLTPANIYFNDPAVKRAYDRPLISSGSHGGYDATGGDWGAYPGIRFMFGQMEEKAWPYPLPGKADILPPSPPTGLRIN